MLMQCRNYNYMMLLLALNLPFLALAQVGIGTPTPSPSAVLEISSTTKGLLLPRLTTAQRNNITSPPTGLQVYNLDDGCTDTYDGSYWMKNCPLKQTGVGDSTGTNQWTKKNSVSQERHSAVGFSVGTKGYLCTGELSSGPSDILQEYDPATNTWSTRADLSGVARSEAVGFSIGTKGYIATGYGTGYLKDFWQYNPATNSWTQYANFGGSARQKALGFAINGKGYIGAGIGTSGEFSDFWEFNPATNTWTSKANIPGNARTDAIGFGIGTKGYVGSGKSGSNYLTDFYEYDPSTNTWLPKANMPGVARTGAVGVSTTTKGYFGTGLSASNVYLSDFWEYDPVANAWTAKSVFGGAGRTDAAGFAIGNKVYVATGKTGASTYTNDLWEYTPTVVAPVYTQVLPYEGISSMSDGIWNLKNNHLSNTNYGNTGIGSITPNLSAKLDVVSSDGGLLVPRMSSAQKSNISFPANGLLVYDNTLNEFWVYNNGWKTLFGNATGMGNFNLAVGNAALESAISGEDNTAVDRFALAEKTSGMGNTALGIYAGDNTTTGNNNTFVGAYAYVNTGGGAFSNMTALGYNSRPTASNTIRLGNSSIADVEAFAPYTDISDGRYKRDVQATVPGLDFIRRLRPLSYHLDAAAIARHLKEDYQRDTSGQLVHLIPDSTTVASRVQKSAVLHSGFIAQEVEAAAQEIGYDFNGVKKPHNDQDFYGLHYALFTPPLGKAIQELEKGNKALAERATALENEQKLLLAALENLKTRAKIQADLKCKQDDELQRVQLQLADMLSENK